MCLQIANPATPYLIIYFKDPMLPNYQLYVIRAILEHSARQLQIVRNDYESNLTCGESNPTKISLPKRNKLDVRFNPTTYTDDGIFYRVTGERYEKAVDRLRFDKLRADKFFIIKILKSVADNLKKNQPWLTPLRIAISDEIELADDEHEFIVEYVRNRLTVKRLTERLTQNELEQSRLVTPALQMDDIVLKNAMRLRYTRSWETARQEQLLYQLQLKERFCLTNMRRIRSDMNNEKRCYAVTEQFLLLETDNMKNDCVVWMHKYDKDYDAVEMDTQVCKDRIEETMKKTTELRNEYEKRQLKMDTYLKLKQDEIDRELNLAKMIKLTTLIQAWWRGTMVRNKLGPFKKKKKSKGKKSKKATR